MDYHYVRYEHHGKMVTVREDLKGKHREHCLCWTCPLFKPENRENSCPRANLLYALDVALGMTTPVWECPDYPAGRPSLGEVRSLGRENANADDDITESDEEC
jgi:hypothetical protein